MTADEKSARSVDVLVVGGGPAGLSAALVLGRCRRKVLLCDAGEPRNQRSAGVGGYLSRDGCPPEALRRVGREEIAAYPSVSVEDVEVSGIERLGDAPLSFRARLATGKPVLARRVILATGLSDQPPDIPGMAELFGYGVWTCPYCDGWELRDRPVAVFGPGGTAVGLALELRQWTADLVLLTHGPATLSQEDAAALARAGIRVVCDRIAGLDGGTGHLTGIRFDNGELLPREALFYVAHAHQRSQLVEALGCELTRRGTAETGTYEQSTVPGVFVAGDASRRVQFAIVAAAEGAMAAFAVNNELTEEDWRGAPPADGTDEARQG
jgi:thioredoxin reductase